MDSKDRQLSDREISRRIIGFWSVAATITVLVLCANIPLPLLTIYQAEWHFTTGMLTVIYGVYTVGVVSAVFLLGPLSDDLGRKRVLLPALGLMGLGLVLGWVAPGASILIAARLFQGLAIGAGVTTCMAALGDLVPPSKDHAFVALITTSATVTGLAGGPLVAGILAQYSSSPTTVPYMVGLLLLLIVTASFIATPETVTLRGPVHLRPRAIQIPAAIRSPFLLACFVEMTAYAVAGTIAGLGASFVRDLLHDDSHTAAGAIVAVLFLCSAAAQIVFRAWSLERSMLVGLLGLIVGIGLAVIALASISLSLFYAATLCLGIGHGLAYVGSQELIDRIAPADRRAEVLSGFQLALYVGATAPALAVGFGASVIGFQAATYSFLAITAAVALCGALWVGMARPRNVPSINPKTERNNHQ